jgi:hypothetical protein
VLAQRRTAVKSLRATGKLDVTVDQPQGGEIHRDRLRASQAILVRSPASFRLEALSPFGVSYAVASDGRELAVLIPNEGSLYRGPATARTIGAATGVAATPAEATELLLGSPAAPPLALDQAWLSVGELTAPLESMEEAESIAPEVILHAPARDDPHEIVVVGFSRTGGTPRAWLPVLFERITTDGQLEVRARFGAFRPTPAGLVATRIEIEVGGAKAVLRYGDLVVNPDLDPAKFAIATPAGMHELRFDAAGGPPPDSAS